MKTSQTASSDGKPSSFFVFCMNDFATKLSIPQAVEEDYTDFLLQESLQLKSNESDRCWDVKIEHIDGEFFIVDGWSDFVRDYNLLDLMLLVFRIVGPTTLHVDVFDHHSCLQLLPEPTPTPGDEGETSLRFVKELVKYNIKGSGKKMYIPKAFVDRTGIATSYLVELEDESGRKWPISLNYQNKTGRYTIVGGWPRFAKGNNLQIGNILLFEFVPDSDAVLKVSVMEEGAGRELIAQASHGGFLGQRTRTRIMRRSLKFVRELTESYFKSRSMHIPKDFAESTGMATSEHIVIDLEDESGRKWPVSLTNRNNSGLYQICGGWPTFLKANHLQIGTILLFEFVPDSDNVVKVTTMEERAGRELLAQAGCGGLLVS